MEDRIYLINLYDYYGDLLTTKQKEYFEKKGFQLPKKCKKCRGQHQQTNISGSTFISSLFDILSKGI